MILWEASSPRSEDISRFTLYKGDHVHPYPYIMPQSACDAYEYLIKPPERWVYDEKTSLYIPQVHDVEFVNELWPKVYRKQSLPPRQGVSAQVKACLSDHPVIFTHPDQEKYLTRIHQDVRHPTFTSGFAGVDYLQYIGLPVSLRRDENASLDDHYGEQKKPHARFGLYTFFATAEIGQIFTGDYLTDIKEYIDDKQIRMPKKRLISRHERMNFLPMPWILTYEDREYVVQITIHDIGAIHGKGGLKEFYKTTGVAHDTKEWAHKSGYITHMHEGYWQEPDEFDEYCVGDLNVYEALKANNERFQAIYRALGCQPYYRTPKLTIGSTIEEMFQACLYQLNDKDPRTSRKKLEELLDHLCKHATSDTLRQQIDSTAALLSKVEGGRCRNNQPILLTLIGAIVDLDLAGCYADGLRAQLYPLGTPVVLDFPWPEEKPNYPTLRQFLEAVHWGKSDCALTPGLWHARISTAEGYRLVYPQDFFASWRGYNRYAIRDEVYDPRIVDDNPTLELNVKTGYLKVFYNELHDATLTHDGLQIILEIMHSAQRQEFLDHVHIHACMFYPSWLRVDTPHTVLQSQHNYKATQKDKRLKEIGDLGDCLYKQRGDHHWYGINLGKLLVDKLLAYRQMFKEKDDYSQAMNKLFKLAANTLFGVLVSPYFKTSNACVGANITGRARAGCWCSEKGFHGSQAITDGVQLDLNRVVNRTLKDRVTVGSVTELYTVKNPTKRNLRLSPLGRYHRIGLEFDYVKERDPEFRHHIPVLRFYKTPTTYTTKRGLRAMAWMNRIGMPHLRQLFPRVDVLHQETTSIHIGKVVDGVPEIIYRKRRGQFSFAMKRFYSSATFHGSADNLLENPSFSDLKMRGYESHNKIYYAMRQTPDGLEHTNEYEQKNPARKLMEHIRDNPDAIPPDLVCVFSAILKASELQKGRNSRFAHTLLTLGDDIYRQRLLKEWSLSLPTYRTAKQYEDIRREFTRCRNRYSWYIEPYFLDSNGDTRYRLMVETADQLIREEKTLEPHERFHPTCDNADCPHKEGRHSLLYALDPYDHFANRHKREDGESWRYHPAHKTYMAVKELLTKMLDGRNLEEESDDDL